MNLIDEIEGVIADIEAGQANEVCVRTLKRVCEALSATSAVEPSRVGGGRADADGQVLLIRTILELQPLHSTVEAVRVLYEQGRDAFEAMRGSV